jgi:hypothetical protein
MSTIRIVIAEDAADYVARSAKVRGIRKTDVIRKALEAYRYLEDVNDRDGQIAFRRATGRVEILRL